jgi:ABC-type Zn uptake system ZnuABC Zn-binding protein ZnuA
MRSAFALAAALCGASILLAGCGGDDVTRSDDDGVRVVATTTPVADLTAAVIGEGADVHVLLPAGVDPHDHEIRAEDVAVLADADVVVRSGGELDEWLGEALESAGGDAAVVDLMAAVRPPGQEPHWWLDPVLGRAAVAALAESLGAADPGRRTAVERNARREARRLKALEGDVRRCLRAIPAADRELVTTHDAFGAYARRFGLEVVGALVPARSDHGQPSAGETADLVAAMRRRDVRAVFPEPGASPRLAEAVAREAGARVGPPLWVDSLGPAGSGAETYAAAIAADTRALIEGLTGRKAACALGE